MKNLFIFLILSSTMFGQTSEELDMVIQINKLRANPKSFIPYVQKYIKVVNFKKVNLTTDTSFTQKSGGLTIKHKSTGGSNMINYYDNIIHECDLLISELNNLKPVKPIELSVMLYPITKQHAVYLDSTNTLTHDEGNITFIDRFKYLNVSENCVQGNSVEDALLFLLLDIDVKDKGHRKNIFRVINTSVSVAKSGNYWVQNFLQN